MNFLQRKKQNLRLKKDDYLLVTGVDNGEYRRRGYSFPREKKQSLGLPNNAKQNSMEIIRCRNLSPGRRIPELLDEEFRRRRS